MNNKVIINNENDIKLKSNNIREVSKNEAMNGGIKNKDIDLTNVLNKMNLLKKENEDLKKKIYQIENNYNSIHNNNSNQNYEDSTQKNLEKIKFLQTEKRLIEKQLIEHNKCIEEQNLINKEYKYEKEFTQIKLDEKERYIKYNQKLDFAIIEIKAEDKIKDKYFLTPNLNDKNFINENIIIVQFPLAGKLSKSEGKIIRTDNYKLYHDADTKSGSSGSPIFLKGTTEVIGK